MNVKFCGAAGSVTGSSHLITLEDGTKILLDCGLHQGKEEGYENYNNSWLFKPSEIDVLILSHAHIDHCGRIPQLLADGFQGSIFCTHATRNLAEIMLLDSAFIQEKDTSYINKKRIERNLPEIKPLYTVEDAKKCIKNFVGIGYDRWFPIHANIEILLKDAGHILGSASVTLKIQNAAGKDLYFGFSGDVGRPDRPILRDPQPMPQLDYLILESTYGGVTHNNLPNDKLDLLKVIQNACVEKKGKLLIPAFSVGRTQELVYMLDQLEHEKLLPSIPVYVDSPLAFDATQIFLMHPECYDADLSEYLSENDNPFGFKKLHYIKKVEDSKALNNLKGPAIIISASGMMSAGRIKHHVFNNIEDSNNTILMVGFCGQGTLGRIIADGAKKVRIFGEEKEVKAEVVKMDSFSAHGDNLELLDFIKHQNSEKLKTIFLVHGEIDRQTLFKENIHNIGFKNVVIPSLGESFEFYF